MPVISPMPRFTMHWHVRQCIVDTVAVLQCYLHAIARRDNCRTIESRSENVIWTWSNYAERSFNIVDERGGTPSYPLERSARKAGRSKWKILQ